MRKKIKFYFLVFLFSFVLIGCGKDNSKDIINKLDSKIKNANSYYVDGVMEIINNEDTYTYDVKVSYKKDNYYKVDLVNTLNNHEQVILKNDDGVYVVTPSLNKSFKFQSDWPYNNSQIYLLDSIIDDLINDNKIVSKKVDNGYVFSSSVNYPNNKLLYKQNVYIDNKKNITKVEVTDKKDNVQISMKFNKIKFNKDFDDNYFELSNLIKIDSNNNTTNNNSNNNTTNNNSNNNTTNNNSSDTLENNGSNTDNASIDNKKNEEKTDSKTKNTATINDVIYPMYLPNNTTLANKEVIDTKDGQRLILTFEGDNPFILVEETAVYQDEGLIIPVSGDLEFLTDVIGVVSDNSLTWESNGIEYYLVSDTVETSELIEIAQSINVLPVSK